MLVKLFENTLVFFCRIVVTHCGFVFNFLMGASKKKLSGENGIMSPCASSLTYPLSNLGQSYVAYSLTHQLKNTLCPLVISVSIFTGLLKNTLVFKDSSSF